MLIVLSRVISSSQGDPAVVPGRAFDARRSRKNRDEADVAGA